MLAIALFYYALITCFSSPLFNLSLIILAIFVLIKASDRVDKINHLGKYADENNNNNHECNIE
jgi:hypothetical protein